METQTESLSSNEDFLLTNLAEEAIDVVQQSLVPREDKLTTNLQDKSSFEENLLALLSINNLQEKFVEEQIEENLLEQEEEDSNLSELTIHPLFLQDTNEALSLLANILLSADEAINELQKSFEGPICPYEASLIEYLGPNYKIPSAYDITIPSDFTLVKAASSIDTYIEKIDENFSKQLDIMMEEAADTNFCGITSENLGNAFSELLSTSKGQEYVINKEKVAQHLQFAEMVRTLPDEYILDDPYQIAFKLMAQYTKIIQ